MTTFTAWLINELSVRGLSQSGLARKSKLTSGAISHVISGSRKPGPDLCTAIANALNYPPDLVFRKAGLLPELDRADPPGTDELTHRYRNADDGTQREILDFVRFKTAR